MTLRVSPITAHRSRSPGQRGGGRQRPGAIYNVGNNHPEELMHVVAVLEKELGREAVKQMLPMQPGDVTETYADIDDLTGDVASGHRLQSKTVSAISWRGIATL